MSRSYVDEKNKAALEYAKVASPIIKDIVAPFFAKTNLTHFSYTRYMDGEKYLTLSADSKMVGDFFSFGLDRYMLPENLHIPEHSKRVIYWDLLPENENLEFLRKFNYSHGLSTFVRHADQVESWHFATDIDNSQINQFYMNQQNLIDKFLLFFQEKAAEIIQPADEKALSVFSENRSLDLAKAFDNSPEDNVNDLIRMNKYLFKSAEKNITLSNSEFECLRALSCGYSIKAIAKKMGISPRTIETHLNNVKTKADFSSKCELLDMFNSSVYKKLEL